MSQISLIIDPWASLNSYLSDWIGLKRSDIPSDSPVFGQEALQKKIVRIIAFKAKYDHTDPLFHQFNMLKIERINEYMSLIFVYKSLKNNNSNMFIRYIPLHYNTRLGSASSLSVPDIRSNHSRQSIRWTGSQLWNALPQSFKEYESLNAFKINIKRHLLTIQ